MNKWIYLGIFLISSTIGAYFIKNTLDVYKNRSRLIQERQNLANLQKQNEQLQKELQYRETDEFIINEARDKLNYGFSNEQIVIVPKDYLKKVTPSINIQDSSETIDKPSKIEQNTAIMWFNTFF